MTDRIENYHSPLCSSVITREEDIDILSFDRHVKYKYGDRLMLAIYDKFSHKIKRVHI